MNTKLVIHSSSSIDLDNVLEKNCIMFFVRTKKTRLLIHHTISFRNSYHFALCLQRK